MAGSAADEDEDEAVLLSRVLDSQGTPGSTVRRVSAVSKYITRLDPVAKAYHAADTVFLSSNSLRRLRGLEQFQAARVLSLQHNLLHDLDEVVDVLAALPNLAVVNLDGNPVARAWPNYRARVVCAVPTLQQLDARPVTAHERVQAPRVLDSELTTWKLLLSNALLLRRMHRAQQRLSMHGELPGLHSRVGTEFSLRRFLDAQADDDEDLSEAQRTELTQSLRQQVVEAFTKRRRGRTVSMSLTDEAAAWSSAFADVLLSQQQDIASTLSELEASQTARRTAAAARPAAGPGSASAREQAARVERESVIREFSETIADLVSQWGRAPPQRVHQLAQRIRDAQTQLGTLQAAVAAVPRPLPLHTDAEDTEGSGKLDLNELARSAVGRAVASPRSRSGRGEDTVEAAGDRNGSRGGGGGGGDAGRTSRLPTILTPRSTGSRLKRPPSRSSRRSPTPGTVRFRRDTADDVIDEEQIGDYDAGHQDGAADADARLHARLARLDLASPGDERQADIHATPRRRSTFSDATSGVSERSGLSAQSMIDEAEEAAEAERIAAAQRRGRRVSLMSAGHDHAWRRRSSIQYAHPPDLTSVMAVASDAGAAADMRSTGTTAMLHVDVQRLQQHVAMLKDEVERRTEEQAQLASLNQELRGRVEVFEARNQSNLAAAQEAYAAQEAELQQLEAEYEDVATQLQQEQEARAKLTAQLANRSGDTATLQQQLSEMTEAEAAVRKQLSEAVASKTELAARVKAIEGTNAYLQQQLEDLIDMSMLQTQSDVHNELVHQDIAKNVRLQRMLEEQLARSNTHREHMEGVLARLENELAAAGAGKSEETPEQLRSSLLRLVAETERLQSRLLTAGAKIRAVEEERDAAAERAAAMMRQLTAIEQERSQMLMADRFRDHCRLRHALARLRCNGRALRDERLQLHRAQRLADRHRKQRAWLRWLDYLDRCAFATAARARRAAEAVDHAFTRWRAAVLLGRRERALAHHLARRHAVAAWRIWAAATSQRMHERAMQQRAERWRRGRLLGRALHALVDWHTVHGRPRDVLASMKLTAEQRDRRWVLRRGLLRWRGAWAHRQREVLALHDLAVQVRQATLRRAAWREWRVAAERSRRLASCDAMMRYQVSRRLQILAWDAWQAHQRKRVAHRAAIERFQARCRAHRCAWVLATWRARAAAHRRAAVTEYLHSFLLQRRALSRWKLYATVQRRVRARKTQALAVVQRVALRRLLLRWRCAVEHGAALCHAADLVASRRALRTQQTAMRAWRSAYAAHAVLQLRQATLRVSSLEQDAEATAQRFTELELQRVHLVQQLHAQAGELGDLRTELVERSDQLAKAQQMLEEGAIVENALRRDLQQAKSSEQLLASSAARASSQRTHQAARVDMDQALALRQAQEHVRQLERRVAEATATNTMLGTLLGDMLRRIDALLTSEQLDGALSLTGVQELARLLRGAMRPSGEGADALPGVPALDSNAEQRLALEFQRKLIAMGAEAVRQRREHEQSARQTSQRVRGLEAAAREVEALRQVVRDRDAVVQALRYEVQLLRAREDSTMHTFIDRSHPTVCIPVSVPLAGTPQSKPEVFPVTPGSARPSGAAGTTPTPRRVSVTQHGDEDVAAAATSTPPPPAHDWTGERLQENLFSPTLVLSREQTINTSLGGYEDLLPQPTTPLPDDPEHREMRNQVDAALDDLQRRMASP